VLQQFLEVCFAGVNWTNSGQGGWQIRNWSYWWRFW